MNQAHIHLILNHIPVLGTFVGLALLIGAYYAKSSALRVASLSTFVLTAIVAVVVFLTGEPAEDIVKSFPGVAGAAIELHEAAGKISLIAALGLGFISLGALYLSRRPGALQTASLSLTLFVAVVAGGLMAWTANLGGQIRHPEIATVAAVSQNASEHDEHEVHHDD